jgi:hypothetical protein
MVDWDAYEDSFNRLTRYHRIGKMKEIHTLVYFSEYEQKKSLYCNTASVSRLKLCKGNV